MEKNETVSDDDISNFKRIFANLPDKIKSEDIILVLDKKPYTWHAVFLEVNGSTPLGIKMLKKLKEFKII